MRLLSGSGPPAGFAGIRNGSLQLYGSDSWEAAFKMASIRNIEGINGALSIDRNPGILHLDGFENMVNVTGDVEIDTNANLVLNTQARLAMHPPRSTESWK